MATAAMSAITNDWLPTEFHIDSVGKVRDLFAIYAIGFFISNLCIVLLNWHALRHDDRLALTPEGSRRLPTSATGVADAPAAAADLKTGQVPRNKECRQMHFPMICRSTSLGSPIIA